MQYRNQIDYEPTNLRELSPLQANKVAVQKMSQKSQSICRNDEDSFMIELKDVVQDHVKAINLKRLGRRLVQSQCFKIVMRLYY